MTASASGATTPGAGHDEKRLAALARDHQSLIHDIIHVVDYVDGWLCAASDAERSHIEQLRQRLLRSLIRHGVRPTARQGAGLDLRYHEVVETVPGTGAPADTIMEIVLMGYELLAPGFDPTTLRQAKVSVAATEQDPIPHGEPA